MSRLRPLLAALLITALVQPIAAQSVTTGPPPPPHREFETRAELEAAAKDAESQHRTGEAWLLHQRLEKGDFQEGDRILVTLRHLGNTPTAPETLTVRAGKTLQIAQMADLSLEGVLRSELTDRLTHHVGQYLRDPSLTAVPLLRLAVIGEINHPGYYYNPADILLTDVIMKAGGPSGNADMKDVVIRRAADIIWNADDVHTALTDGLSLDRLHLRAGDEVFIGRQRDFPWMTVLQISITVLVLGISFARR